MEPTSRGTRAARSRREPPHRRRPPPARAGQRHAPRALLDFGRNGMFDLPPHLMHRHPIGRGPCVLRQGCPTDSPDHLRTGHLPLHIHLASPRLKFRPHKGGEARGIGAPSHCSGLKEGLAVPRQGGLWRRQGERCAGRHGLGRNALEFHICPRQRRRSAPQHQGSGSLVSSHIPHLAFKRRHLSAVQGHDA